MAEENEVKKDADAGEKIDMVLKHIADAMTKLDSVSTRMDAMEEEKKADKARRDAEEAEEEEKKDEGKDPPEDLEKGEPKELAADKAKKDEDDEEEKKREDKARKDSEEIRRRIDAVEKALPKALSDADLDTLLDAQARADSVFNGFGKRAPRPLDGENVTTYRRRVANALKGYSAQWKDIDLGPLSRDDKAFSIIENQIYADAEQAALHPADLSDGELRAITSTDPQTGVRQTRFAGKHTFIRSMSRPPRYATSFNTHGNRDR
ncbi:MAG: hypothetical protein KGL39_35000 [Patescibacteria group bacterium]|nr:hypothetical protein [Patescibacteria group bacterium]